MLLSQIYIYPIKSARGIAVNEVSVQTRGPAHDRSWMLVDDAGLFLSQRRAGRMAWITPRFEGDDLLVEAPGMPPLHVRPWRGEGDWVEAQIWDSHLRLPHPDSRYDAWFSAFLGQSCRLVYLPQEVVRPVEPPFDGAGSTVSLSDGFPLLVISEASLHLLNDQMATPVDMNRFRPNLVISGCAAHAEDNWKRLRISSVELAIVKPCARCSVVLIDQETCVSDVEPLKTLSTYRRSGGKVMFGQNALVLREGTLTVGHPVELLGV